MHKHEVNNFSWYIVNNHHYVNSNLLTKINLGKGIEVYYDLNKGRFILVKTKKIETDSRKKVMRMRLLKDKFKNLRHTDIRDLTKDLRNNKNYILEILQK